MTKKKQILDITNRIYIIRGQKVMLDRDLAELYGVELRVLNQAVKRNINRFPSDFHFKLTKIEFIDIGSQNVILDKQNRFIRKDHTPTVFTEQGAFSLSFVLKSQKAVEMGIFIARAFTHLRRFILKNENLIMELKNNDHLSKTFSNFEKRIEQSLIVIFKNNSINKKKFKDLEKRIDLLEKKIEQ